MHVLTPGNPTSIAIYNRSAQFVHRDDSFKLFSGFGNIGGRFVFGGANLADVSKRSDISGNVGQFTYFNVEQDGVRADTDLLGHGHLFASQHDSCAVLSNRLHLHTLVLKALGFKLELNDKAALSLLFTLEPFFSQQYTGHEMLTQGVSVVPVNKRVTLNNGVLALQPKAALEYAITAAPDDYQYLVDVGVQELLDNTNAVLDSSAFGEIIVDLSGGKDSRMVFGSVLNFPKWQQRIGLNTVDIPSNQDLPIACGIANHFGGSFHRGSFLPQTPISFDENMQIWRSYFHGLYHRIGASAWTYDGRNRDSISLSGGSGEILRTAWGTPLRHHLMAGDDASTFASRFVSKVGAQGPFEREHQQLVAEHLASTLGRLPGATLGDKLESHYLFFRNRSHFGLRGFALHHERATWFPLMSASLLKAAHSIPFGDRSSGRLIRDIMQKLHPDLMRMPFDGKGFEGSNGQPIDLNTNRSAWEDAMSEKAKRLNASRVGHKPTLVWSSLNDDVRKTAIQAHEEALSISSSYRDFMPSNFVDVLNGRFAENPKKSLEVASALFAVRDSIS
ncbi:hypothetical protein [Massilia sp.]|uniref:hypothetical protein n=1 Tax=Massilia sp. TaxID=1882437 RepID=UPI0028A85625|nr:hypothetical protein [Massilia sp.]